MIKNSFKVNNDQNILTAPTLTPLGCTAPVGATTETCTLKFDVIEVTNNSDCSNTSIGDDNAHLLCGFSVVGLTKYGLSIHGHNAWQFISNYERLPDGTVIDESIGTHIKLESSTGDFDQAASVLFSISVLNNTAGHRLWNGYTLRNIEVSTV